MKSNPTIQDLRFGNQRGVLRGFLRIRTHRGYKVVCGRRDYTQAHILLNKLEHIDCRIGIVCVNGHQEKAKNTRFALGLFRLFPNEIHEIDNERNVLKQLAHNIRVEIDHQQENVNDPSLRSTTIGVPTTTAILTESDCFRRMEKR